MILANFHTHSRFCDGTGELEDYVQDALRLGFHCLGFTSHAPLPFYQSFVMKNEELEDYCALVRDLKLKYWNRIELYLGLEIDFIPGITGVNSLTFQALGLDYTIGSIHIFKTGDQAEYICLDESDAEFERLLRDLFGRDVKRLIKHYYSLIRDMVEQGRPDVIGHLDVVKKFNWGSKYFNEEDSWYRREVLETLPVIASSGAVLEVNTGGISRGYIQDPYPSQWILRECNKLGIPIMLNSDAHSPRNLTTAFTEVIPLLKEAGYFEQRIMLNGTWQNVSLEQ